MIHSDVLKRFLTIFLPLAILMLGIAVVIYYTDVGTEKTVIKADEINSVNIERRLVASNFKSIVADLMIISEQHQLKMLFESAKGSQQRKESLKWVNHHFRKISKNLNLYDQLRVLDETGMEIVRINYNNGNPVIVPEAKLQFKGNRYYFKDTFGLGEGEVFVSPFDLNIEGGKIEQPINPMIRFGIPVFNHHGQKRGIVILNYLGMKMINDLEDVSANLPGHIMLLNSNGYWLHSQRPEDNWGFMYEDKKDRTFGNVFPDAWQQISSVESGQFIDDKAGMFTFVTIYPPVEGWKSSAGLDKPFELSTYSVKAKSYYWKIISHIPPNVLYEKSRKLLGRLFIIYTVLFVLLAITSWSLAHLSGQTVLLGKKTISPFNALATVAIVVFLSEMFVMFVLKYMTPVSPLLEALIDSTLLLVLLSPALYFLLFRPLIQHIAERKWAEEQREVLIDNLNKVNAELKDFAYIVSHDLKAPLRAISSLAGWIKKDYEDVLDNEGKENLDLMLGRTRRMDKLIGGILQYSRLGRMKPELEWLESDKIAHKVIDALHIPENIKVQIKEMLPRILYDRTHLEQIFQNLFNNAIKHLGKPVGEVVISCEEKDGFWKFCVSDNGVGIEERHFERIFKIFQSLRPRDEVETTGIGLFLVKKIVEGRDGQVWVESKVGEGSSFFFTIPKSARAG